MDLYFLVAELAFPAGTLRPWLTSSAKPTKKDPDPQPVAKILDEAEGDLVARIDGDTLSLRAALIDAAFFVVAGPMQPNLVRAAALGAKGTWYAGGYFGGTQADLEGSSASARPRPVKKPGPPVAAWIREAGDLADASNRGVSVVAPRLAAQLGARPAPPPTPAKRAAKAPAKGVPAKRAAKAPAKGVPAKRAAQAPARRAPAKTAAKAPAKRAPAAPKKGASSARKATPARSSKKRR